MSTTIHIQIDRAQGSLQRLIGLIERRGFHIDRIAMSDAGACRDVRLTVRPADASRCPDVLGRQIDRLIGVRRMAPAVAPVDQEPVPCPA